MKKLHSFDNVFDGQKMFRIILKAMSNPLKELDITEFSRKLFGNQKNFLAIAYTLMDNESTFFTFDNKILDDNIMYLTFANKTECSKADYIFVKNEKNLKFAIENAKIGTLVDPHKSATIIVALDNLEKTNLTLKGPGVKCVISLDVDKLVVKSIEYRDFMNFEYPQGIDFIFIDNKGKLFAIPRLLKKVVK